MLHVRFATRAFNIHHPQRRIYNGINPPASFSNGRRFFFFLKMAALNSDVAKCMGQLIYVLLEGRRGRCGYCLRSGISYFFFLLFSKCEGDGGILAPSSPFSLSLFFLSKWENRGMIWCLPVVILSAVQFRIFGETSMGQSDSADGAEKTSFVVGDVGHSHDVTVANGPATHSAHFHFGHSHRLQPRI